MDFPVVTIGNCPPTRCEDCSIFSNSTCKLLENVMAIPSGKIVILFEKERGMMHIGGMNEDIPSVPPWTGNNWFSVICTKKDPGLQSCVDVYRVGSYLSFFFSNGENRCSHYSIPILRSGLEQNLLTEMRKRVAYCQPTELHKRINFDDFLTQTIELLFYDASSVFPQIKETVLRRISNIVAQSTTVLFPIIPLILDDKVEEIYFDRQGKDIYFDHTDYGRCLSRAHFEKKDVDRITTLLRVESNMHLDKSNPSMKATLNILGNSLRTTAMVGPLAYDGFSLSLRRRRRHPFSLQDLVENQTLPQKVAATLVMAINNRMNITITGAPGSGKTTLLNALDAMTPSNWRKIYIEDALESRLLRKHHQLRLHVDPVDEMEGTISKSNEIIKSLHRSPDYVILGEIQTGEHSRALFESLAAGLHSIQTCHADSASGLMSRWALNHGISDTNLAMMDVIVTLHRPQAASPYRMVKELAEIRRKNENGMIRFGGMNILYSRNESNEEFNWCNNGAFMLANGDVSMIECLKEFQITRKNPMSKH